MSDEETKPIEEKIEVPTVDTGLTSESTTEPITEPTLEVPKETEPISELESVSSLPAKEEMPEAEKVESSIPEPISPPEPTSTTPPASSHLPLAGEENPELIASSPAVSEPVSSPPAKGEMPKAEGVNIPAIESEPKAERVNIPAIESEPKSEGVYSSNPKLNAAALAFISYMSRTKETLALANKARKAQMMKRVYKVMDLFKKKQKIKNDDVEKFIHTDDSTATKYLNILIKENKIRKVGKNHAPYYIKNE